jgi:hypothetical protein
MKASLPENFGLGPPKTQGGLVLKLQLITLHLIEIRTNVPYIHPEVKLLPFFVIASKSDRYNTMCIIL